jgi:hypothetical protein
MPVLAFTIYLLAKPKTARWIDPIALLLPSVFVASFLAVSAPWMLRNCLVLKGFEPLGTQGSSNLAAGYSAKAFEQRGRWFPLSKAGFYDHLHIEKKSLIEREIIRAKHIRKKAFRWALKNPLKVPMLVYFKIRGLWKPYSSKQSLILAFGLVGSVFLLSIRPQEFLCLFSLLIACSLATGLTWTSVAGRYLVPVLPILTLLASLGIWCFFVSSVETAIERLNTPVQSGH